MQEEKDLSTDKSSSQEEVTTLKEQQEETPHNNPVELLEKELASMKDNWMRSVADLENYKRRAQKEREDALKFGATQFAKEIVSVADNMKRALESFPQDLDESLSGLLQGIQMVEQELLKSFEKQGILKINALGEKFDPNIHQAVFEIPDEQKEAGIVVQVVQEGYMLHDRLLRPAMVGVSKK